MKKTLIGLLAVCALPAAAQEIGGKYTVQGSNLNGSTYSGEAVITLTSETTCQIVWKTGATEANGICMRNDNSFAAGYVLEDAVGLVIYKVLPDGTLNGLWTVAGEGGSGTEVLIPVK
jgi:hypothetical protein